MSKKEKALDEAKEEVKEKQQGAVAPKEEEVVKSKVNRPKINLARFLQIEKTNNLLRALLEKDYSMQTNTLKEWQEIAKKVLLKKIR